MSKLVHFPPFDPTCFISCWHLFCAR